MGGEVGWEFDSGHINQWFFPLNSPRVCCCAGLNTRKSETITYVVFIDFKPESLTYFLTIRQIFLFQTFVKNIDSLEPDCSNYVKPFLNFFFKFLFLLLFTFWEMD